MSKESFRVYFIHTSLYLIFVDFLLTRILQMEMLIYETLYLERGIPIIIVCPHSIYSQEQFSTWEKELRSNILLKKKSTLLIDGPY